MPAPDSLTPAQSSTKSLSALSLHFAPRVARAAQPEHAVARILAIGNFDGVHIGHQAIVQRICQIAHVRQLEPAVLTFSPHPRNFFAPNTLPQILTLRDKVQMLWQCGVTTVAHARFNAVFAALSPRDFVDKILHQQLNAQVILVGSDFKFGAKRAGDFAMLQSLGAEYGMQVNAMPTVFDDDVRASSTRVRQALSAGDFVATEKLLGRPYAISGHVLHGQKLGRTLGFPTLNLRVPKPPALQGIFAVRVMGLDETVYDGVASLGSRPTVDNSGRMLLETHVFNYHGNAYGKIISIEFVAKIRDEEKYHDLATLQRAIETDAANAKDILKKN